MRFVISAWLICVSVYGAYAVSEPFFHEYTCTNDKPQVVYSICRRCVKAVHPDFRLPGFGCTTGVKGKLFGRNYDWMLGAVDEYLLRVPPKPGRHASIGVASLGALDIVTYFGVTPTAAEREACLPYLMMDGVNDAGVAVSCHFVELADVGGTTGTCANASLSFPCSCFVREALDRCGSAREVAELAKRVNFYAIPECELQWLAADRSGETYAIGIVSNRVSVVPGPKTMVNYSLTAKLERGVLPPLSSGMEREKRLQDGFARVKTVGDMAALLRTAYYSDYVREGQAYAWWSELNGTSNSFRDRYPDSPATFYHNDTNDFRQAVPARLDTIVKERQELAAGWKLIRQGKRPPESESWATLHSCVYDLENLAVEVRILESNTPYRFKLNK